MSAALITKRAIAASLKRLMEREPPARISVRKIVEGCGLNRQTFYYHFRDKHDRVNWIYENEALSEIANLRDHEHWTEGLARVFAYLFENRSFYVEALNMPGQNAFDGYLFDATRLLIRGVADELAEGLAVAKADKVFICDFYAFAFVGVAVRWIKSGMGEPPEKITRKLAGLVEGSMRRALEKCSKPRASRLHGSAAGAGGSKAGGTGAAARRGGKR
jgi:probable dihydroxyacetone kinase regulator